MGLKIKTSVNQTYLFDLARYKQENRSKSPSHFEQVLDRPVIDSHSRRLAEEKRLTEDQVHERLYKQGRKDNQQSSS